MDLLEKVNKLGTTVLVATHNTDLVARYKKKTIPFTGEKWRRDPSMGGLALVRRTFGVMKENGAAHFLSIGTIAISFFLFAAFLLLPLNFASLLEAWEKKVQIILYLKDGVEEQRIIQLTGELRKDEGVREVRYISQRAAKESFERDLAGYGGVLQGVKEEIFRHPLRFRWMSASGRRSASGRWRRGSVPYKRQMRSNTVACG